MICLRPMTEDDADLLHNWRSDERVYRYLKNPKPPAMEEHRAWAIWVLRDKYAPRCFIADHIEHGPVGFCSFHPESGEIGIYTAPEHHGKGFAADALALLVEQARKAGLEKLKAVVHPENVPARALYRKLGFKDKWVTMETST